MGAGEIEQKQNEVDDQGVFHHVPEIDVLQKRTKMRKSHPVAEQKRFQKIGRVIRIFETQKQTHHRNVMKHENIHEPERGYDKNRPVSRIPFFSFFTEKNTFH